MSGTAAVEFALLTTESQEVIVESINAWATRLTGCLPQLKAVLGEDGRKLGMDSPGRSEDQQLRTILLSAVLTSGDPNVARSEVGQHRLQQIAAAASALGVAMNDVQPLSSAAKELFAAIDSLVTR